MRLERRESNGHRDGGAVAVETAFVSVLLIILLFGIVESSFLFKDWLTVSAATRAGARMGSSQPRALNFAQDSADQVTNAIAGLNPANLNAVWVYRTTDATGLPDSGSFASCGACVKFTWDAAAKSLKQSSGTWPATSQNACPGDPSRDALGVYVSYTHSGFGFFFKDAIVSKSTAMWIEPSFAMICKP